MPHLSAVMRRTPCHSKHFRLEGIPYPPILDGFLQNPFSGCKYQRKWNPEKPKLKNAFFLVGIIFSQISNLISLSKSYLLSHTIENKYKC